MVKQMINKADFKAVERINDHTVKLMFRLEDVKEPVYVENDKPEDKDTPREVDHYEDTDYCMVLTCYYKCNEGDKLNEADIKKLVADYFNPIIDATILDGFVWNGMKVWLSSENQFNYKAAFDLAAMTQGATLPVKFKFGTDHDPQYHEFTDINELQQFYTSAIAFVNKTLNDGWEQKDSFDWSLYTEAV